jgi:hypothetical protein
VEELVTIVHKAQLKREALGKQAAQNATNFDDAAQRVWAASDLDAKKQLADKLIISQFAYPKKIDEFRAKLQKCIKSSQVDKLVGDIILYQSGNQVLK